VIASAPEAGMLTLTSAAPVDVDRSDTLPASSAAIPVRERLRLLQGIPLFRDLAPADLLPLALAAEYVIFPGGETIVHQGDPGNDVFLIVAGRVQVVARVEQGRIVTEATLASLGAGDSMGELSLLDGEPRSASCVAIEDAVCLRLRRLDFLAAVRDHWALGRALFAALAERIRRADAALVEFARDPLTGLYCRGALADLYDREVARLRSRPTLPASEPAADTLAILYMDVDQFKEINDQFGHSAGDDVLRAAAARLMALTRRSDVVARHGGDEFVVLLADADVETAERIAGRIRTSLTDDPPGPVPFSMSIGVALVSPSAPEALGALLQIADAEMYREKAAKVARIPLLS
jgi:diguanylate cyclase (GGDEF)-like protein